MEAKESVGWGAGGRGVSAKESGWEGGQEREKSGVEAKEWVGVGVRDR